jgi:hypothetical protein
MGQIKNVAMKHSRNVLCLYSCPARIQVSVLRSRTRNGRTGSTKRQLCAITRAQGQRRRSILHSVCVICDDYRYIDNYVFLSAMTEY